MRARPESTWKDYNVTARDLVSDSEIYITFSCLGCRLIREVCLWNIGSRLADEPLQRMRFRCRRCGVYPEELKVERRKSMAGEPLFRIKLNPACFDDGHRAAQVQALAKAEKSWAAKGGR